MDQAPPVKPPEKAEKVSSKPASKAPGKKGKTTEEWKEEALDPVAEKLRQQRYKFNILISTHTIARIEIYIYTVYICTCWCSLVS